MQVKSKQGQEKDMLKHIVDTRLLAAVQLNTDEGAVIEDKYVTGLPSLKKI